MVFALDLERKVFISVIRVDPCPNVFVLSPAPSLPMLRQADKSTSTASFGASLQRRASLSEHADKTISSRDARRGSNANSKRGESGKMGYLGSLSPGSS